MLGFGYVILFLTGAALILIYYLLEIFNSIHEWLLSHWSLIPRWPASCLLVNLSDTIQNFANQLDEEMAYLCHALFT